ncbi:MAG: histidine kinase [Saprospiraceae bacterium]
MSITNARLSSGKFYQWVFHLVLWMVWIGLPIINAGDNEKYRQFTIALIPASLMNIPLFLLNSNWLIPKIFRKRGLGTYLVALLLLIGAGSILQLFMKEWLIPEELMRRRWNIYWAFIPVFFVTAISTGYGFILYLISQEKAKAEEQREKLKSELSFLRSQISPHFIFNILNSIVYLIRSKSDQAEPVTIKLSSLMRYMLYSSGEEQVPLSKELEYLQNYIELQKIRFEEDVTIKFELKGQVGVQLIEPMLLIPFVENAFKHGVGMIVDPVIDIVAQVDEKNLHFWVRNKKNKDRTEEKDASSGIGLPNVLRRLELLYPSHHQVAIEQDDDWFSAHLHIAFSAEKIEEARFEKSVRYDTPHYSR